MLQPVQKKMAFAFWILAMLDIIGIAAGIEALHFIAKPMLMPALLLLLFYTRPALPRKNLLLAGLFFSWLGDVLLLFEYNHKLFFILGLASFSKFPGSTVRCSCRSCTPATTRLCSTLLHVGLVAGKEPQLPLPQGPRQIE
jgi:hypothetical protein